MISGQHISEPENPAQPRTQRAARPEMRNSRISKSFVQHADAAPESGELHGGQHGTDGGRLPDPGCRTGGWSVWIKTDSRKRPDHEKALI